MRHARLLSVLLALLLFIIPGCAAKIKQKFLDEPYAGKAINAALAITDIEVVDGRGTVDNEAVSIPSFTFKKVGDTIVPPLTMEQEKVIHDEIRKYATGEGTGALVRATINQGVKQYSMGFFNAREYAAATVTIELLQSETEPYLFKTSGESYYEVKSTRADTLFLETIYRKALQTCVYKAFESVASFLEKRGAEQVSEPMPDTAKTE
ncbi:MAG: hypothetical protein JW768_13425 [Chitinispirillaceae bacterium]|nr:hypothetical protein [Chitinispirillaceae bacterium]